MRKKELLAIIAINEKQAYLELSTANQRARHAELKAENKELELRMTRNLNANHQDYATIAMSKAVEIASLRADIRTLTLQLTAANPIVDKLKSQIAQHHARNRAIFHNALNTLNTK